MQRDTSIAYQQGRSHASFLYSGNPSHATYNPECRAVAGATQLVVGTRASRCGRLSWCAALVYQGRAVHCHRRKHLDAEGLSERREVRAQRRRTARHDGRDVQLD